MPDGNGSHQVACFSATSSMRSQQLAEFATLRDAKAAIDKILVDQDSVIRRQQETITAQERCIAGQASEIETLTRRLEHEEARVRGLQQQLYGFAQALMGRDGAVVEYRATTWLSDNDFNALVEAGWTCAGIEEDGTMSWLRPLSADQ